MRSNLLSLVSLYRSIQSRPHCSSAIGMHAWTCKLILPAVSILAPIACGERGAGTPRWLPNPIQDD